LKGEVGREKLSDPSLEISKSFYGNTCQDRPPIEVVRAAGVRLFYALYQPENLAVLRKPWSGLAGVTCGKLHLFVAD
jgi:hypothetical protein